MIKSREFRAVDKIEVNHHTKKNTNKCKILFCFISSLYRFVLFCNWHDDSKKFYETQNIKRVGNISTYQYRWIHIHGTLHYSHYRRRM